VWVAAQRTKGLSPRRRTPKHITYARNHGYVVERARAAAATSAALDVLRKLSKNRKEKVECKESYPEKRSLCEAQHEWPSSIN
jgi:hypothetical protein